MLKCLVSLPFHMFSAPHVSLFPSSLYFFNINNSYMVVFFWECINFSVGFVYDLLAASRYTTDGPAKQDISFCWREFGLFCFVHEIYILCLSSAVGN